MTRPEALQTDEPLLWSVGRGTDVWELFNAAANGDLPMITALLDKDPALVRSAYDYRPALYFAVKAGQADTVRLLLQRGANPVNFGFPDTNLQVARDRGLDEIRVILETAIAGSAGPAGGELMAATIRERDTGRLRQLLDADPGLATARDERTNQPVHWAALTRQPEVVDLLLEKGADIDARRSDGALPVQLIFGDYQYRGWRQQLPTTPEQMLDHFRARGAYIDICSAAYAGDIERVGALLVQDPSLANKTSPYITWYAGSGSPLRNAAAAGHMDIVRLLLAAGADPNLPEEFIAPRGHALHSAAYGGHTDIVRLLLEHGAFPNAEVESSADTLSMVIQRKDTAMADLLCSYGASRSIPLLAYYGDLQTAAAVFAANPALANDPYGLECAAGQGHTALAKLMVRYCPGLPKRIAVGVATQGPQAAASKNLPEWLFANGMDPNHRNWLGVTPLHTFARCGDDASILEFIRHGADVNAVDEEFGTTPLGYAAKYGKEATAGLLLANGANTHPREVADWSQPLAWAKRKGNRGIVTLLEGI
jgi:ankyrin repeat protein